MNRFRILMLALTAVTLAAWSGSPADASEALPDQPRKSRRAVVPPPPLEKPTELYDHGGPLDISFPKYFTFLADGRGLGEAGAIRVKVKKRDPLSGAIQEGLFEVREVGEVLASEERGALIYGDGGEKARYGGKVLLSTNDQLIVRMTDDLAKIIDADTYGQSDPYFREFPIYGVSNSVREPMKSRVDRGHNVGELYRYKGNLTLVARVEGLAPIPSSSSKALKAKRGMESSQGAEPVSYVARITYSVDAVELSDRIFLFHPLDPGPERVLEPPFVEKPDSYVSLGR